MIIGNPPWLSYRNTASTLRAELERQSKELYGIWTGGRYATHQDVAGLFFARSVDLYLKAGGVIGMVMPHSTLQTGQHAKWRTGLWRAKRHAGSSQPIPTHRIGGRRSSGGGGGNLTSDRDLAVDFGYKTAWDLEGLEPNTFFPVPASVVFARKAGENATATPLPSEVERWLGEAGATDVRRTQATITDASVDGVSPYGGYSRNGATIFPRRLFFVEETGNPAIIQAGQTVTVNPRRGSQDKEPWRNLDLAAITGQTIDTQHVFDVHLGETLVPYATLDPLKAVLPLKPTDTGLPADNKGVGGVRLGGLGQRMRDRWQTASRLWEENKAAVNKLRLLERLDYYGNLSAQLEWQRNPGGQAGACGV